MTTDTALGVSKLIVHDKSLCFVFIFWSIISSATTVPLEEIPYVVRVLTDARASILTCWLGLPNNPIQRERECRDALQSVDA